MFFVKWEKSNKDTFQKDKIKKALVSIIVIIDRTQKTYYVLKKT